MLCQSFLGADVALHLMSVDRVPGVQARSRRRDRQLDATVHATHLLRPRPILGCLIEHHPVLLAAEALPFTLGGPEMDPASAAGAVLREGDVPIVFERSDDTHITARRNDVPPDALKQYLVEMTNTATDPSFRFFLGTGDPKTCKVDLWSRRGWFISLPRPADRACA